MNLRTALIALLIASPAAAQSVQQSGTVTRGHVAVWNTSGVIADGGSSASSPISSIGVTNNGGAGICVNSALPTSAGWNSLCLGASTSSAAVISLQNYGTAPAENIIFKINGNQQGFPTVTPLPVTIGNVACFSTTGGGLTDCGEGPSTIPLVAGTTPTTGFTAGQLLGSNGNTLTATNMHLVVYTVAPAGASVADKARADYIGDGVNDQNAVNSAVIAAAAINSYSKVVMLPGVYNFSGTANVSGGNGFVFEARGTQVNGAGVGTAPTATDTFLINGSNWAEYNFGSIKTNNTGTAAAIHSTGGYSETKITWQSLDGTARSGYGYFADSTSSATSQSVNWITATHVQNFAKGLAFTSAGTGSGQDTFRITVDYIYNNIIGIYEHTGPGATVQTNTFIYNVNIDCHHTSGDIGLETNGFYDSITAVIGPTATLDAGTCINIQLDSGVLNAQMYLTPVPIAVLSGSIADNSGNASNNINGSSVDGFLNGSGQLVKYGTNGQSVRTGLSLGTIGAANTLPYFSALGVLSSLATANSSVLVTNGGGVPSLSTTLPAFTLGGNIAGGGNQINNVIIGTTTPLAGFFTTTSASTSVTSPVHYGGSTSGSTLNLQSTSNGSPSGDNITLTTGGIVRETLLSNGNLGLVKETNPQFGLTISNNATTGIVAPSFAAFSNPLGIIAADGTNTAFTLDVYQGGGSFQGFVLFRSAGGTAGSKSALTASSSIGQFAWTGYDGTAYTAQTAAIVGAPTQNWNNTAHGTNLSFYTTPNSSVSLAAAMTIQASGGLSIGNTTDPAIGGLDLNGQLYLPNNTSDSGVTDTTACWRTGSTPAGQLLHGTGTLGICLGTSGRQFKTNFTPMIAGIDEISQVKLWNYRYKPGYGDSGERMQYGPTAQDVETVLPDLVRYDASGSAINYDIGAFVPITLHAIQQIKVKFDNVDQRVSALKADNDNLRLEIEHLKKRSR